VKIVIDTNILVSGILKDRDPERVLLFAASHRPDVEWIVSPEILTEYNEVLGRKKFQLPAEILHRWSMVFVSFTTLVYPNISLQFPPDQKDAKFLTCAISSNADYLVTGDRDFAEAQRLLKTTFISVSLFLKHIVDPLSQPSR